MTIMGFYVEVIMLRYRHFVSSFIGGSLCLFSIAVNAEIIDNSHIKDQNHSPKSDQTESFLQCAKVADNVGRLACFDKVAHGEIGLGAKKEPLDLVKTIATSIQERKTTPILARNALPVSDEHDDQPNLDKDNKILQNVGVSEHHLKQYSPLSTLYDLDVNDSKGVLNIRPHFPMYVLPIWYNSNPNRTPQTPSQKKPDNYPKLQNLDSKIQISFKTKILEDVFDTNADVWFGYTQQAYWQVYNSRQSRPFRSSDYQPEIFITQPVTAKLPFKGDLRMLGAGLIHQSNGQSDPLSRSWNRAYLMGGAEWKKLTLVPRVWFILPNLRKKSDNPDIGEHIGYGDVRFLYDLGSKHSLGGLIRYNPSSKKGAIQLDYSRPISGGMKGYLQLFHGYGENIQDYNHKNTNIGIGLMFNDFTGL